MRTFMKAIIKLECDKSSLLLYGLDLFHGQQKDFKNIQIARFIKWFSPCFTGADFMLVVCVLDEGKGLYVMRSVATGCLTCNNIC